LGKTVSIHSPKETKMKTFAEQIKGFETRKTELSEVVKSVLTKAADEGRTLDAEEATQHDEAVAEIEQVEKHLSRLQAAEKIAMTTATPVTGTTEKAATAARSSVITVRDNLAPGQEFARYAKCLAQAKGNLMQAEQIAKSQYPDSQRIQTVLKAAVASGTTTDATWAGPLVEYTNFTGDFINFLRPQTIIGRFGQGGVPALRSIPFNVRIKGQTSGGEGYWVGEGAPKPLTKMDFNDVELRWAKVANIAVLTDELVRMSTPSAELLVRDSLAQALIARLDVDFVNPAKDAVADVSPASITNSATAVPATGTDYDAFKVDAKVMMGRFIAANISLTEGVWIMQSTQALAFSLMQNALGQAEFPGMSMNGGTLLGLPVIVSQHVPSGVVALAAASEIYLADDGQVMIDTSREATLMMDSAPTSVATRSMFQHNEIAIRAERYINWSKRRAAAVQHISGAAYA
jgi:HK97 family phage major capsid protein